MRVLTQRCAALLTVLLLLFTVGCSKPSEVREQSDGTEVASDSAPDGKGSASSKDAPTSGTSDGPSGAVIGGSDSSSNTEGGGDKKKVSVPPVSQDPTRGVTATTIKLGFIVVSNNDKLLSGYGVRGGTIGDTQEQVDAVVADINSRGGILGRKVVPVTRVLSATGDGTEQYNAMCAGFTQDDDVFAVLSPWNPDPAFGPCLAKKGTFLITDALLQYDAGSFDDYAPYIVSGLLSSSRAAVALARGLHQIGYFKGAKLGIAYSTSPIYKKVLNEHFKPTLASLGVKPIAEFAFGSSSATDAVLYMKDKDVDHVVFLSSAGGNPLFFMTAAQSQGYFPTYGLGSTDSPAFQAQNAPYTQLRGAKAVGWVPAFDVLDSEGPPLTSNEKRCLGVHKKAGTDYGTRTEAAAIAMAFCDMAWLFEEAAIKAGKNLTKQGWADAIQALGSSHASTLTFGTDFTNDGFDGAVKFRPLSYDESPSCRCWKYTGSLGTVGR